MAGAADLNPRPPSPQARATPVVLTTFWKLLNFATIEYSGVSYLNGDADHLQILPAKKWHSDNLTRTLRKTACYRPITCALDHNIPSQYRPAAWKRLLLERASTIFGKNMQSILP
jgi:hypothetical protein